MKFDQIEDTLNKKNMKDVSEEKIRVDMHCHSSFSDGALSPALVAKELSDAGVKYAALTDHNTIDGLPAFSRALMKYGIGFVAGVEITTEHKDHVLHLLGYGFDPEDSELTALLNEKTGTAAGLHPTPKIYRTSPEIIDIIHSAGGIAVMAHPFQTEPNVHTLKTLVKELADLGLDGIEALYGPNSKEKEKALLQIANKSKLFVSAGTDFHKTNGSEIGKSISIGQWKRFRNALIWASSDTVSESDSIAAKKPKRSKNKWFAFIRNILLPAVLSLALFVVALFVFILPYFEDTLMERKRENIRQLSQAAWGVLNQAREEVDSGQMTLEQAQTLAKKQISSMRYGVDNTGYFWLQDTSPRIVMHPFRTDLNDQDVSYYEDAQGTRIFVEFADVVLSEGEGYVSYVWQWVDDEERLEQKESFVRLFEPWDWVIGTGIYINDVQAEITSLRNYLANISIGIVVIVMLILLYLIRQGVLLETSRTEAETLLMESTERYQALSEAATEGALFVFDGRCRYANTVMYELLGCASNRIELLDVNDVFPDIEANKEWLETLAGASQSYTTKVVTGFIRRCNGNLLSCKLTVKNEMNDPNSGSMILVRRSVDIAEHTGTHVALNRLLHIPSSIASDLAESIKNAHHVNEVVMHGKKTPGLAVSLLENGTSSIAVAYMISTISDLITQKIIELAIKELGPPPAPYAFLALGSHGRQSQTLFSDQDNALIYKLSGQEDADAVQQYFLKFATIVCDDLELAGYEKCTGGKIASNPEWCKPMSVWKSYFSDWIHNSTPQTIIEFSVLFDFRPVSGEIELAGELRDFIYSEIKEAPFFISQIAQNALIFRTPLRLFGNIMTSGGKNNQGIDIKTPAMAIITFARLYTLNNAIRESNTLLQLDAIKGLGIILDSKHRDIITAYETLVRLRLWNQVLSIERNLKLDNFIEPSQLGHMEEILLRESFKEIDELQALIQREFLA